jgi:hypothetical protein
MLEIVLFAATVSLPLIIAAIPFKWPPVDEKTKKLTGAGYVVIALVVLAIVAAVWLGIANGKDMGHLQSSIDTLNGKYDAHARSDSAIGLTFDPKTGKVIVVDSNLLKSLLSRPVEVKPVEERPVLEAAATGFPNPRFSIEGDTAWTFEIDLKSNNKSLITHINDRDAAVAQNDGIFKFQGSTSESSANESSEIGDDPVRLVYHGRIIYSSDPPHKIPDTIYNYIKIIYANRNGKIQPPFIRIFKIINSDKNSLPEADSNQFEQVKRCLIREKKW